MTQHSGQWKRGFAMCLAGEPWNEAEPEDWQRGWKMALSLLHAGRIKDFNHVLLKRHMAAREEEYAVFGRNFRS